MSGRDLSTLSRKELEAEVHRLEVMPENSATVFGRPARSTPIGHEELFSAIEKTRMPMILTDPRQHDDPIVFANRAFQQLSGYGADELLGRNCRFLQGAGTDPADVQSIREALKAEKDIALDLLNYRKDGTPFLNELYISPVFDAGGRVLYHFGSQVDVTGYRRDRRELEISARRQRSVFDSASDFAIVVTDRDGLITDWNSGAAHVMGWTAEEMIGQDASRFFTPEDNANGRVAYEMDTSVKEGRASDERWHLKKGEERFWASGEMMPLRDDQDAHIGFVKILRDRTTEHLAGIALRREEDHRKALLELTDQLAEHDDDTASLADVASGVLGRALGVELVGYGLVDPEAETILVERDWTTAGVRSIAGLLRFRDFGSYIEEIKRGETVAVTDARTDPRTRAHAAALEAINARALVNTPVFEHGRFVSLLFVCSARPRDWTDDELSFIREVAARTRTATARRQAESSLREATALLAQRAETLTQEVVARTAERDQVWRYASDLLSVLHIDGRMMLCNPAWTTALGWTEAELIGHSMFDLIHPDDQERSTVGLAGLARGETVTGFENRYRHKDGSYRWLSWNAVPTGDRIFSTTRDVTEAKEQALALEATAEALRQSQKMEAVGQLTGGVAHDFNNLLTIIRSSVDFLRRPNLPEDRRARYMDAVSDTVDRAAKLTGQLLAFARRQALKPEVLNVGERLRAIADMLDTVTGARIRVVAELPDAPCFIRADVSQFETALINMAVNARDAMDGEGTLTLRLHCSEPMPPIRGHAGGLGPFARIELSDTGSGIAAEGLSRIFEPFFTTKEVGKGTGLGLSQVFGFTKQSGGDVDVHSVVGEGTTFTLYLPEVEPEAEPAAADDSSGPGPGGGGLKVLVVEDNIEVGRFATQILEDLGYRTEWAANAETALDKLGFDGAGFDAVFSDVVMPGMGGIALAEELRRRLPRLLVVLASGYSHVLAQDGSHGFELLQKPYSADQLSRILHRVTRGKRRAMGHPALRSPC